MESLYDKALRRLKKLEETTYRQPVYHYPGQPYFYVFGFTGEGKKVFLGPFTERTEADVELAKLDDGEIFESPSRSLAKATREIKAELMSRGEDADEALRRMLHRKGLDREESS